MNPNDAFENALRRDAALARQRITPASDLEQRILREVHHARASAAAEPVPQRFNWRVPFLSLVAAAACAALALVLLQEPSAPQGPGLSDPVATASDPTATHAAPAIAGLDEDLLATLRPEASALLAAGPLQSEVDAVVSDARSALHFLALNFLPATADSQRSRSG